jgi:hypothetical protein
VLGVVLLRQVAAGGQEPAGDDVEATTLDAAEDLAAVAATHRVRLDQDECPLDGHFASGTLAGCVWITYR